MNAKKFKIVIESNKDFLDGMEQKWKLVSERKVKGEEGQLTLSFHDLSMVAKVLSSERLRLLQTVKEMKPPSVNQLAKLLGRSQQNVHKDVQYLSQLGILELKRVRKKGQKKESVEPVFRWNGFDIAV